MIYMDIYALLVLVLLQTTSIHTVTPTPPVPCVPPNVPDSTYLPNQASFNSSEIVAFECDTGYELTSGNLNLTCNSDGTWLETTPVCSIVNCSSPDVDFGTKQPDTSSTVFNTSVTYACDTGYNITSGDAERTCEASGDLSGALPVCSIKTCTSPDVTDAAKSPNNASIDYNTDVTYSCNTGYNHTNGDLTRTCQANITLTGIAPTCSIVTCDEPANVSYATKSPIQSSYNYSAQVTYTCGTGYKNDTGDLIRTCTEYGNWSGVEPACINVTCEAPVAVDHATISIVADPYLYNTTITYTCDTGYEITSGSQDRTCQQSGVFSGTSPNCTIKTCAKEDVANGTADPDQALYNFNTSVTYSCNLAFNHTDGNLTRTCDENANFTGALPVCTVAACIPENITLGTYTPADITTEFGDVITYICDLGYYISAGDENRTCLTNGGWSNTLPTCSLVRCDLPDLVPYSTHTPSAVKYDYNTSITYSCNLAYNHTGGNLTRTCMEDFSWSGEAPNCTLAACIQENSTYMTTTPDKEIHEFDDYTIYECILGYNHSSGDLNRTCEHDGNWTGITPECVIITCDPPDPIAHTFYVPNGLIEHDWNTSIHYSCDPGYHYVSGGNISVCNESGSFPVSDMDCSVLHEITVSSSEPTVTWFNVTVNETSTVFDFDGMCDVTISCTPDLFDVNHVISGNELIMTVTQTASTRLDEYNCTLSPFRGDRIFPDVTRDVFFGNEILDFQAWLDHTQTYIAVGETYHFVSNASSGSLVSMLWEFEENATQSYEFSEEFTNIDLNHIFSRLTYNR